MQFLNYLKIIEQNLRKVLGLFSDSCRAGVSDVRGVTLSKCAKRDLTEILLLLAIHKSIRPHCASFNCSKDRQANLSLFRFPINDKKLLSLWLAALKACRRPQTEYILAKLQRALETLLESLPSRHFHSKRRGTGT